MWLLGLCLGRIFIYATFMVYAACLPILIDVWHMSAAQAGSIAAAFTLAYAASLILSSLLAERLGARSIFLWSAITSAATALAFGLFARDYWSGLVLYTLSALTQGGMYTPGLVLMAERYASNRRGGAVGWLIGSTALGHAFSLAVSGVFLAFGDYQLAFLGSGVLPSIGAAILWATLRRTPNTISRLGHETGIIDALWRDRNTRSLVAGYTWHCWELLGMWAWVPAFLAAAVSLSEPSSSEAAQFAAYSTAGMHIVGALSSSTMGYLSDVLGRRVVLIALAAGGALFSLVFGWLVAFPLPLLVALLLIYGFLTIGDSPVLSTAVTESVLPARLGSVLGIRALIGFGAGAISPVACGAVLDLQGSGIGADAAWGPAFMVFALGGILATWYAIRFKPLVKT